jgi:hypothetical protein
MRGTTIGLALVKTLGGAKVTDLAPQQPLFLDRKPVGTIAR